MSQDYLREVSVGIYNSYQFVEAHNSGKFKAEYLRHPEGRWFDTRGERNLVGRILSNINDETIVSIILDGAELIHAASMPSDDLAVVRSLPKCLVAKVKLSRLSHIQKSASPINFSEAIHSYSEKV